MLNPRDDAGSVLLINTDRLQMVKRCLSTQCAEYWAELLCKGRQFCVLDLYLDRHWAVFSERELIQLYGSEAKKRPQGLPWSDTWTYGDWLKQTSLIARELPTDQTGLDALRKKLGHEPPAPVFPKTVRVPAPPSFVPAPPKLVAITKTSVTVVPGIPPAPPAPIGVPEMSTKKQAAPAAKKPVATKPTVAVKKAPAKIAEKKTAVVKTATKPPKAAPATKPAPAAKKVAAAKKPVPPAAPVKKAAPKPVTKAAPKAPKPAAGTPPIPAAPIVPPPVAASPVPPPPPVAKPPKAAKPPKEPKPERIKQNGITLPRPGTESAIIWAAADTVSKREKRPALAMEVVKELGDNPQRDANTTKTLFHRWKTFHGLVKGQTPA